MKWFKFVKIRVCSYRKRAVVVEACLNKSYCSHEKGPTDTKTCIANLLHQNLELCVHSHTLSGIIWRESHEYNFYIAGLLRDASIEEITSQFTLHYIACLIFFPQNLATLLITWQLIQQFQECLIPYLIYKHRTKQNTLAGEDRLGGSVEKKKYREGKEMFREQYPVRNHPHLYSINCWIFSCILFEERSQIKFFPDGQLLFRNSQIYPIPSISSCITGNDQFLIHFLNHGMWFDMLAHHSNKAIHSGLTFLQIQVKFLCEI